MASVTFSVAVGGDGSTVTDDGNVGTGLANGGHRVRFVPAMAQVVAVAQHTVTKATEANDDAAAAAASEAAALGHKNAAAGFAAAADESAGAAAASAAALNGLFGSDHTKAALPDGTVAAPVLTFQNDLNSGIYRIGDDNIGVAAGGAKILDVSTAGLGVTGGVIASGSSTLGDSSTDKLTVIGGTSTASTLELIGGNSNDNATVSSKYSLTFQIDNTNTVGGRSYEWRKGGSGYSDGSLLMTLTGTGDWIVGSANGTNHTIAKQVTRDAGNVILEVGYDHGAAYPTAYLFSVSQTAWSSANAAMWLGRDAVTGRGLNSGGGIYGSGADTAEYEVKSPMCPAISKGQIVGFDAVGELTLKYADACRFGIKTTNPHLVGGDVWGTAESLGQARPQKPVSPPVAAKPDSPTEEEQAALEAWMAAMEVSGDPDQAYRLAMINYEADLASFELKLESARQWVDRIAYSGKVPVNVLGATPGDYIIAVEAEDGTITGRVATKAEVRADHGLYLDAVGRVNRIIDSGYSARLAKAAGVADETYFDGMCEVAVIVH